MAKESVEAPNWKLLRHCVEKREWCRIYRFGKDDEWYDGVPLKLGRDWLLIRPVEEFHFDGYVLIRRSDITRIDQKVTFRKEYLTKLHAQERHRLRFRVPLTSLSEILAYFQKRRAIIAIHFDDAPDPYLFLGRITHIGKRDFRMITLSMEACWDVDDEADVGMRDVSAIHWDTEYNRVYEAHAHMPKDAAE